MSSSRTPAGGVKSEFVADDFLYMQTIFCPCDGARMKLSLHIDCSITKPDAGQELGG